MKKMMASLALAGCLAALAGGCGDDDDDNKGAAGSAGAASSSAPLCKGGKNAYDTYGAAFLKVNDSIFVNVGAEITANGATNLGSSFQNSDELKNHLDTFKTNLANFLVVAYGGPNKYTGRDMKTAHTGLAITQPQYDYFVQHIIVPALTSNGVPSDDLDCFAKPVTDPAFVATIVGQ